MAAWRTCCARWLSGGRPYRPLTEALLQALRGDRVAGLAPAEDPGLRPWLPALAAVVPGLGGRGGAGRPRGGLGAAVPGRAAGRGVPGGGWAGAAAGRRGGGGGRAETGGWRAARTAARAPIEWPTRTTGTGPWAAAMPSSSDSRSATGDASAPFQPRTRNLGRRTRAPLPRTACRMAAATGIMRSTAG